MTTCAGLWRYLVGDTVTVVERDPPRVLVTGRTSYMLSAFGEHVIGAEVERAVAEAARAIGATVTDFTAGSVFPDETGTRGGHLYIVELGAERAAMTALDAARAGALRRRARRDALPPQRRLRDPPFGRLWHGRRPRALSSLPAASRPG